MAKFLTDILAKAGIIVDGAVTFNGIPNAATDTDRFLVIDGGVVKYRTGAQILSDIAGVGGTGTTNYVPKFTSSTALGNSLIFDNGTNVGINMTTANHPFQIRMPATVETVGLTLQSGYGSVVFKHSSTDAYRDGMIDAANLFINSQSSGKLLIGTTTNAGAYALQVAGSIYNTTGAVLAASSGNVGIGITSPSAKLDVNGTLRNTTSVNSFSNSYTAAFGNTRIISATNPQFELWHDGNSAGQFSFASSTLNYGVHTGTGTQTTYLTIQHAGNVGIGTASPSSKLHVNNSSATNDTNTTISVISAGTDVTLGPLSLITDLRPSATGSSRRVEIYAGDNANYRNITFPYANVGIGTASPGSKLSVVVAETASTTTGVTIIGNVNAKVLALGVNSTYAFVQSHGSVPLYINELGNNTIINPNTGGLGVGTTSPSERLHVNGRVRIATVDNFTGTPTFFLTTDANGVIQKSTAAPVTGSGTTNYVAKFTSASTVGDSSIADDGTGISISAPRIYTITDDSFLSIDAGGNTRLGFVKKLGDVPVIAAGSTTDIKIGNWSTTQIGGNVATGTFTETMRVTQSGRVLIGFTTNLGVKLQVNGDALIQSTGTGDGTLALRINNNLGNQVIGIGAAGGIIMQNSSKIKTVESPTSSQPQIELYNNATGHATFQSSSSYSLLLNPAGGNVGIGTTSPNFKLDVNGTLNVRSNYAYFGSDANTAVYAGSFSTEGRIGVGGRSSVPTADLTFYTADGTNNFERMRITSAGNVGIGTISPGGKLHVNGGDVFIGDETNVATNIRLRRNGGTVGSIGTYNSQLELCGGSSIGASHMVITPIGNVGIGTANPIDKLHIVGDVRIGSTTTTSYSLRFTRTNNSQVADANYYVSALNTPVQSWIEGGFFTNERAGTVTTANSSNPYYEEYLAAGGASSQKTFGFINKTSGSFVNTDIVAALTLFRSGQLRFPQYTSTTSFTGTVVAGLGVDSSGNLITTTPGGVSGSGTTNYIAKFTGANSLGNSQMYDDGISVDFIRTTAGDGTVRILPSAGGAQLIVKSSIGYDRIFLGADSQQMMIGGWPHGGNMQFWTGGSERMRIASGGNIGIGTTNPTEKLTVTGDSAKIRIESATNPTGYYVYLQSNWDATNPFVLNSQGFDILGSKSATSPAGTRATYLNSYYDISLNTGGFSATTSTTRLYISNGGNVSIGSTTDAGYRLDVNGTFRASTSIMSPEIYGTSYSTIASGSGTGTGVFDTLTTSGIGVYEVVIVTNPNANGSSAYRDWYIGKLIIGTGWDGTNVVHYINFIQQSPQPRTIYSSGGSSITVNALFNNSGTESETATLNSTYTIRFKLSNYSDVNSTAVSTKIFLKKIAN